MPHKWADGIKNKPNNNKKLRKQGYALDKAVEAKTSWLSEDFKNELLEVSGQNKARKLHKKD